MGLMPMLEIIVHELIKFVESHEILFVTLHENYKNVLCGFVYTFDCDSKKKQINLQFKKFTNFMDCTNDGLLIVWSNNPNTNI